MSTMHTLIPLLLTLTHRGRTMHPPTHCTTYPMYTPPNAEFKAPTTKEHTTMSTPTTTCLTMGMSLPCPSCYMRSKGYTEYTTCAMPTPTYKEAPMRPIHRGWAAMFTMFTLLCMVGYVLWQYTPITYVLNGWGFFLMWVTALVGMPFSGYAYLSSYRIYRTYSKGH